MPDQDRYIHLPDNSYLHVPAGVPDADVRTAILKRFPEAYKPTEAGQVAARPNATAQAQSVIKETIPREEAFRADPRLANVRLPAGTKPGDVVEKENKYMQESGQFAGESAGAMGLGALGGMASKALPKLAQLGARAMGTGAGAGTGAVAGGGASLKDAAKEAGIWGATELGMHALFSGGGAVYKMLADPKLSLQQAAQMFAETLSKENLSPGEFGKSVQEGFDAISRKAGQEKGEFLTRVVQEHPDLTVNPRNLRQVLQARVQALETMKARNPELFKEGEAQERTLRILKAELDSANGEEAGIRSGLRKGNLTTADTRRSQFWNYKQSLDPSVASRIVGELDRAATQDITEALMRQDPKLATEYLQKSARYHELQDLGRAETLKKVFGDKRVAPDKVMKVFVQAPEESLKAIQTMERENPVAIERLRRQLFEQSLKTTGTDSLLKQQPALLRAIYGPQSEAVQALVETINKKAGADALLHMVPGTKGALLRIATGAGKRGITIRASELSKILKSSEMMRLFTQAAQTAADSGPGRLMRETLQRAVEAVNMEPVNPVAPMRRAVWKDMEEPPPQEPPSTPEPAEPRPSGARQEMPSGEVRGGKLSYFERDQGMLEEEARQSTVTKAQVERELKKHGYALEDFIKDHGDKPTYSGRDVLNWMGY